MRIPVLAGERWSEAELGLAILFLDERWDVLVSGRLVDT